MKRFFLCWTLIFTLVWGAWYTGRSVRANEDETDFGAVPDSPPLRIGMVDLGRLFQEYPPLQKSLSVLRTQAQGFEQNTRATQEKLAEMGQRIRLLPAGSLEQEQAILQYQTTEKELIIQVNKLQSQLRRDEARALSSALVEIRKFIDAVAEEEGLNLILRFEKTELSEDPNPRQLQDAFRSPFQMIEDIDITPQVAARMRNDG